MGVRFLIVVLFLLAVVTSSALTVLYLDKKSDTVASSIDQDSIGKLVSKYIEDNPEIIVSGIRKAQAAERAKTARGAAKSVKDVLPQLSARKAAAGNPKGKVTVGVFHDYNCGFCRKAIPDVEKLAAEMKQVKVVIIDLPILGELSVTKGTISAAASIVAPDKYFDVYKAISSKSPRNEDQIYAVIKDLGIDVAKVKAKVGTPEVDNLIAENRAIAQKLGVRGTPAFVIGEELVRGAQGFAAFKAAVERQK